MRLKYSAEHKKCAPCPPASAYELEQPLTGYRLIVDATPTPDDFIPNAVKHPGRPFEDTCAAYALSFFNTASQAKRKYRSLERQLRNPPWNFIAETVIEPKDGKLTPRSSSGHFGVHESAGAELHLAVVDCDCCE